MTNNDNGSPKYIDIGNPHNIAIKTTVLCQGCANVSHPKIKVFTSQSPRYITLMAHPPGLGKSTRIRNNIIEKDGQWFIVVPTHALGDEYEEILTEAGHDCVHLHGFGEACSILQDAKSHPQEVQTILYMQEHGVFAHLICEELGCSRDDCKFRQQWRDLRNMDGNIQKTVIAPGEYINFFEFSQFEGVYIEENHEKASIPPLTFDEKHIVSNLKRMQDYVRTVKRCESYIDPLTYSELKKVIAAVEKKDIGLLRQYAYQTDFTIHKYNVGIIAQGDDLNRKIGKLCLIRMNNIVMYLDFHRRKQAYQEKEEKWIFDCSVDNAIRQLAVIDAEIEIMNSVIDSDSEREWNVAKLEEQKQVIVDSVIAYARELGLHDKYFKPNVETDDIFNFLRELKGKKPRRKNTDTPSIYLTFKDSLLYQMLSSYTPPLVWANAELQFNHEFFIRDVNIFKKLFPEFNAHVVLETAEVKALGRIIYPSIHTGAHFRNFFKNEAKQDEVKLFDKHIQNKITYRNDKDEDSCVLTFKDHIPKNGKLFGVPAYPYGPGSAGVNTYENHDNLFVRGTFLMPESFYTPIWNRYYRDEYGEMPKLTYELDEAARTWLPANPQMREIYNGFAMPQIYNSIHRVRMMRHEVTVFYYAWNLPEPLKHEMDVIFE